MHLSLLDLVLDAFLLDPPLLCVSPPDRTFVFAFHTQIYTGSAGGMLLITLLSAQAACEATYFRGQVLVRSTKGQVTVNNITYRSEIACVT